MGKRSTQERQPQDWYRTPAKAVVPLLPFLPPATRFVEPCAGDGALIRHLSAHGHVCVQSYDMQPRADGIVLGDARDLDITDGAMVITNPPWRWDWLQPIIECLSDQLPTWLLLNADVMHNVRAAEVMSYCSDVVAVGRIKWIEDSPHAGKENAAWFRFQHRPCSTLFHHRQPAARAGITKGAK